jgi:hypothetical protein
MLLLVALFAFVACEKYAFKNEDKAVDKIIAQCKNFSEATLMEDFPGKWKEYCDIKYNETWSEIEVLYLYMGHTDYVPGIKATYEIGADGKLTIHYPIYGPNMGGDSYSYDWSYDHPSRQLTLSGEGLTSTIYRVKGVNNQYIVLDYYNTAHKGNTRLILKRIVE